MLGLLHAWTDRHTMNPDGIMYLDMGDAYLRGDWNMAINSYWSPFYSWLLGLAILVLKPLPYWEFSIVHLVNFAIYLCALGGFHFFLRGLIHYHRRRMTGLSQNGCLSLSEWALMGLGYTLFIWSSLDLITIWVVTPDMCVAAFVYLAAGITLRIRTGSASWLTFVLLGVILGFSYLAKAAMLPLAFVFLGVSMFSVAKLRRAVPRVLVALATFLLLGGPFIAALSRAKNRLTFGASAELNYAWHVNGVTRFVHWQGEPSGSGRPSHPTRRLFDMPEIYEFGSPIGGTYPAWYDPSYWYEGVVLHFDLGEQIRALVTNAKVYFNVFYHLQSGLIVGFLILCFMGGRRWLCVKDIWENWSLLIPAISALGMYSLVHVELRYVGPFVVLLWMGVFSGLRLPDSRESRRLTACVSIALLLVMIILISTSTAEKAYAAARDLVRKQDAHVQWQAADGLNRMGVQPGDSVAFMGDPFDPYWARLARVRIVAEIPEGDVDDFWAADQMVKSEVIKTFAGAGAKAIVTTKVPDSASTSGWERIGNTDYYAYILSR